MMKKIISFLGKIHRDFKQIGGYPVCDYGENFSVNYDKHWKKFPDGRRPFNNWQKQRAEYALEIIEPGASVLDVGCSNIAMLQYLQEQSGIKGIGVDIDPSILKIAQDFGIKTVHVDITNVDFLLSLPVVDYVTAFEILEHMPVPEMFVVNILKKAKKGLIFSVNNTGYYAHRLRLLFGRFPLQWVAHPGEHVRFWTARDMEFWINSLGFTMKKMVLYEGLPVLNKIFPKLFSQGMIVYVTDAQHTTPSTPTPSFQ